MSRFYSAYNSDKALKTRSHQFYPVLTIGLCRKAINGNIKYNYSISCVIEKHDVCQTIMAVSQIVLKYRRATNLSTGTAVNKLGAEEIFNMNFPPFFGKASQKNLLASPRDGPSNCFPLEKGLGFLSTAKQGDNALGSVHRSVQPSVCYHQSKLIVRVSVIIWRMWIIAHYFLVCVQIINGLY